MVAPAAAAGLPSRTPGVRRTARRQRWLEAAAETTAALLGEGSRDDALAFAAERARDVAAVNFITRRH